MMTNDLILLDKDGKEIKCEVIAIFDGKGKHYIAYTDGSMIDNKKETLVSRFTWKDEKKVELEEIESQEEWEYVEHFLENEVFSEDWES